MGTDVIYGKSLIAQFTKGDPLITNPDLGRFFVIQLREWYGAMPLKWRGHCAEPMLKKIADYTRYPTRVKQKISRK